MVYFGQVTFNMSTRKEAETVADLIGMPYARKLDGIVSIPYLSTARYSNKAYRARKLLDFEAWKERAKNKKEVK